MIVVKKFLATVILALMILTTSAFAHKWEWAAYETTGKVDIYIEAESIMNVQELFALNYPCFQALFKASDYVLLFNFRRQGTNLYASVSPLYPNVLDLLYMPSVAQLEEDRYRELLNKGASPRTARNIIDDERTNRTEDFVRKIEKCILDYGTNSDGSINPIGACFLYKMATADMQSALFLARNSFFSTEYKAITPGSTVSKLYTAAAARNLIQIKFPRSHGQASRF